MLPRLRRAGAVRRHSRLALAALPLPGTSIPQLSIMLSTLLCAPALRVGSARSAAKHAAPTPSRPAQHGPDGDRSMVPSASSGHVVLLSITSVTSNKHSSAAGHESGAAVREGT